MQDTEPSRSKLGQTEMKTRQEKIREEKKERRATVWLDMKKAALRGVSNHRIHIFHLH